MKILLPSFVVALTAIWYVFVFSNDNVPDTKPNIQNTIEQRFAPPTGFVRLQQGENSFAAYLRTLPLKPRGSLVTYYDGTKKQNPNVYDAVVDLKIGRKDLHQCADAVIRLRADYFYNQKAYDQIHFNFTNGFRADYSRWRKGERITINGNSVKWNHKGKVSDSPETYWKYLETVFSYAGTASLDKELKPTNVAEIKIGDVFIKGGFPGHAVIVVDVAVNKSTNQKVFLLAQSYMPAQELQLLKNPNNKTLSPWYSADLGEQLQTPEWTFKAKELKQF